MESKECGDEICAEFALHDAMDRILRFLNTKDLCRVAQVCKAWNEAVQSEMTKRGLERILIPDPSNLFKADGSKFHLSDVLRSKPELALLFCGPRPHLRCSLNLEYDILTAYKPQLPRHLLVIVVDVAMMDEKEIRSCPSSYDRNRLTDGILGFFLPKYRQLRIKVGYCESHEFEIQKKANKIVDHILPDDEDAKSTILIFGRSYYSISKQVLSTIKQKFKPNSYAVWGGTLPNFLKTIDCQEDDYPAYTGMEGCVAFSISGPSLERHSALIDCCKAKSEIELQLTDFEKGLQLKRYSQGLVCGPRGQPDYDYENTAWAFNHQDLMQIVKATFPNIPFTGFFNDADADLHYFGLDSRREDAEQELMHTMCMSILILTHN